MKDDYSYWSENLHSAYLFYTLEVDKLNKENKRLREALEKIITIGTKCDDCSVCPRQDENNYCDMECRAGMAELAKQALGE